jgi:hypothetical protein
MSDNIMLVVIIALIGGLVGAVLGIIAALNIAQQNRQQQYYINWIKSISEHNWKLLEHKLDPGLAITEVGLNPRVVCYQHLNLLLLAWLHKKTIKKDGSLKGWKNWAADIVDGAKLKKNAQISSAYHYILTNRDLYPDAFISWLNEEMQLSADKFKQLNINE